MRALLLSALVTIAGLTPGSQPPPPGGPPKQPPEWKMAPVDVDGPWTVVYVEIEGKKLTDKHFSNVMIKDRVLSYKHDGKAHSWRLEFGPFHMVKATEIVPAAKVDQGKIPAPPVPAYVGCYIASQDYLCLALNKKGAEEKKKNPKDIGGLVALGDAPGQPVVAQPGQPPWPGGGAAYSSAVVLILRRDSSSTDKSR
jgi:hypothetical protein